MLSLIGNVLLGFFGAVTMAVIQPVMSVLFEESKDGGITTALTNNSSMFDSIKQTFYSFIYSIIITTDRHATLLNLGYFILGMFVVKNIIKYLSNIINVSINERISRDMRYAVFTSLLRQSLGYFNKRKAGELISVVTNEVPTMHGSISPFLGILFRNPIEILLLLFLLLSLSVKLTMIAFSTSIITLLLVKYTTQFLRRYASRMSDANAGFMTTLQEGISGIRIIKAFNGEGIIGKRFRQHSVDYLRNSVKMTRVNDLVPSISEIFVIAALCVVLYVGGDMVFAVPQQMKGAELMTFLFALFAIMSPVNAITSVPSNIQRGLVAAEKVYAVIDQEPTIIDGTQTITSFKENVTFNNVTFAYNTDDVVKNVTLSIPYGKKVALVGASGSGKSTLVDLLIRFYDPKSGTITMDGLDIKNLTLESYRSRFGIVSQEAILFNDTIANNIAFGAKEINQSDIENAARIAYADEFIKHLPDGYNTYIGDRGVMLSGGQRQRIAIARAIAQNPDILIFDEATSALDSESEKIVQNAINNVLENRTAVIVAHRLSTIINADLIVVFDRGVIAEQGTHKELIDMNGIYKRLYTIQYSQHEETH